MIRKRQTLLVLAILALFSILLISSPAFWATATPIKKESEVAGTYRGLSPVVQFDVSAPLREMKPAELDFRSGLEILDDRPSGLEGAYGPQDVDKLVQNFNGPTLIPSPLLSFDGPSNIAGVQPPDPVGDVGPNHYVAMSNLYFAAYDKSGNLLYGPVPNNTLWSGFGGPCQTENAGDPVVLHDQFSDRWVLTQFTANGPTYYNCVAVSTTSDPTGPYYRYAISTGTNFPDYPKYGIWSDAYYISTREFAGAGFAGVGAYALNRADMVAGNPNPQVISFLVAPGGTPYNIGDGLLPADLDGSALPPSGSPEYFVGSMDNGGPYGAPQDALTLWKFTVNWASPASSSFVLANTLPIAAYDTIFPCSPSGSRNCIPQPGTTNKIDILSYRQRPMWRLAYRNFGGFESLVTNQSVEAGSGRDTAAGIRWWEIRDPNGSPFIYQEGTYAPDTTNRWMASVAMDQDGNMAMGYSASSSSVFPSLWYTGRLAGDPLGLMTQGEASLFNGTASQTSGQRWGDYTSLNVDPSDDCTFWYVNEYLPNSGSNWRLRIGAFKFPTCNSGGPTPTPTNTAIPPTPTFTPTPTNTPPPGSNEMHVAGIDMSIGSQSGNRFFGQALVTIVDTNNQPVSGATVFGTFSGDSSGAVNGVTNASGQVTLTSPVKKNGANWSFCVDNVTKTSWTYNPGANVETCDSTGGSPTATPTPTITPTPPPGETMHIGDLDGSSALSGSRWDATVTITVHDQSHNPIVGVTVSGAWSNGASGTGSCTTDANGQCSITKTGIRTNTNSVVFTVTNATSGSYTYQASANHDPDGDSNGTTITVNKP